MSDIDKVIENLFTSRWVGDKQLESIYTMRTQLYKTLRNQIDGYWSGSTAYDIAVDGGFLKDSPAGSEKQLTALGVMFIESMESTTQADKG